MFRWLGSTQSMNIHVKSAQMINFLSVVSRIPKTPDDDYKIGFKYILRSVWSDGLGLPNSEKAVTDRSEVEIDPEKENEIMANGKEVEVNENDDDMQHVATHNDASQKVQDDESIYRIFVEHTRKHLQSMRKKIQDYNNQVAMNQQMFQQQQLAQQQGASPGASKPVTSPGQALGQAHQGSGLATPKTGAM